MCIFGRDPEEGWQPVHLRRGGGLRTRILCGAVDPSSPFIEGGCATDWIEELQSPDCGLECPGCGQRCSEEIAGCAREMLATRVVFVVGCPHRAFTFSRRECEPYFSVEEPPRPGRKKGETSE